MKRFLKNEAGANMGLFAILLPVLLFCLVGVTDLSQVYTTSQRLQKAADTAALSYMKAFPVRKSTSLGTIKEDIKALAEQNASYYGGIYNPTAEVTITEDAKFRTSYTVSVTEHFDYVFATALGIGSGKTITRSATVSFYSAGAAPDVLPMGIEYSTYMDVLNSGNLNNVTIKYGSHSSGSWRGAVIPLGMGTGASDWQALMAAGIDRVDVGDQMYLENGNMSGPTLAINERIGQCTHLPRCTASHYHQDCRRVCILPVLGKFKSNGEIDPNGKVDGGYGTVVALVPVIVTEEVTGTGVDSVVRCSIIGDMVLGYDYIAGPITDSTTLFAGKLTQ